MSATKRYKDKVDLTVRMPLTLRALAKKALAIVEGIRIGVPGTEELVKPSIAVLALRGLGVECERIIYEDMKRRKDLKERTK